MTTQTRQHRPDKPGQGAEVRRAEEAATSTLERADLIFDALQANGYLTLAEIIRETGIPRSSAHRLLGRMVARRWLLRVGSSYELGVRLFALGTEGLRNHWFHNIAYPHLRALQANTGHTVQLSYLDGKDVVVWDHLDATSDAPVATQIGERRAAHQCAAGKALLAAEPDAFLDQLDRLAPATPRTITDPEQLRAELGRVRERQLAFDRGEALPGVSSIATTALAGPADTSDGHTTAVAIAVSGPTARIDERCVPVLLRTATRITQEASPNPMDEHAQLR